MTKKLPCPNCGRPIEISQGIRQLVCLKCNVSLLLVSDSKLILRNPLPNYLSADQANGIAARSEGVLDQRPMQLSNARMEKSAFHAGERIAQERTLSRQGLYAGLGTLTAGGLLLLVIGAQIYTAEMNWIELLLMGIGIVFVGLGLFITVWFAFALRSNL